MKNRSFWLLSLLVLSTSCWPRYNPDHPKPPIADTWKQREKDEATGPTCPEPSIACEEVLFRPWWQVFEDPVLDTLEAQAIADSPSVTNAVARLNEAKALYGEAFANFFPQVDLLLSASRSKIPQNQPAGTQTPSLSAPSPTLTARDSTGTQRPLQGTIAPNPCVQVCPPVPPPPPPVKMPKPSKHVSQLAVLPELSYEVDFWGKYSQEAQSAYKRIQAQEDDLDSALLILTSAVASTYFELRMLDSELDVLEQTRESRQKSYDLQLERTQKGLITELDLLRAKVELTAVEADLEATKIFRTAAENSLAALIGTSASEFVIEKKKVTAPLPFIPAGLPVSLLRTRPDIRKADRLLESRALDVGVAKTAYFPAVTIFLDGGYISDKFSNLFKWKSHVWSATATAVTNLFDAGRITSQVEGAIARYEQSVASYVDTVLTSFKEVENALSSVDLRKKQLAFLSQEVEAARGVLRLSSLQYQMGLTDYLNVVDAERSLLESEREQVRVTKDQYSAIIVLIKSLGGVWDKNENIPESS